MGFIACIVDYGVCAQIPHVRVSNDGSFHANFYWPIFIVSFDQHPSRNVDGLPTLLRLALLPLRTDGAPLSP